MSMNGIIFFRVYRRYNAHGKYTNILKINYIKCTIMYKRYING